MTIPVNKFSSRLGERVRLLVLHTSEGARTVESLGAYLNRPEVAASYHGAVDDSRYAAYVNYSVAAWHVRDGNQESDGLCLCGWARWTEQEWLSHGRMLDLAAAWLAERSRARGLPLRRLTDAECAAALRDDQHPGGVIDHWTYTRATGDGTHTDNGKLFPFNEVLARAQRIAGGDMATPAETWSYGVRNAFGGTVAASLILSVTEGRVEKVERAVAAANAELAAVKAQNATVLAKLDQLLAAHPKA